MDDFIGLANCTHSLLLAADDVRQAAHAGDDAKLRESVIAFWTQMVPRWRRRLESRAEDDEATKRLMARAANVGCESAIRQNDRYCTSLADVLFPSVKPEWINDFRPSEGEYFQQQLARGAAQLGRGGFRLGRARKMPEPSRADVMKAVKALRTNGKAWLDQARRDPAAEHERMLGEAAAIEVPTSPSPADPFAKLRPLLTSTLRGKQKKAMALLVERGGALPLAALAIDPEIDWPPPYDDTFKSIQDALNKKIKRCGFRIIRHDNCATLVALGQK